MSCVIEEGDPPFTIRWLRNGRPLPAHPPPHPAPPSAVHSTGHLVSPLSVRVTDFNAYSSILTIDQVTIHHAGNYTCRAENAAGSALHAALLQVSGTYVWSVPSRMQ